MIIERTYIFVQTKRFQIKKSMSLLQNRFQPIFCSSKWNEFSIKYSQNASLVIIENTYPLLLKIDNLVK